jgi:hypothetical protein
MSSIHPIPMPSSPCIGICTLDDSGHCLGCRRHIDEIAAWARLPAADRQRILEELPLRDARMGDAS